MSVCDLMYLIRSELFVVMAVNMVGFVNDCFIAVLVFSSEALISGARNLPALFVCVFDLFFPCFLILPLTCCHSSVLPSLDDILEDSKDSEEGSSGCCVFCDSDIVCVWCWVLESDVEAFLMLVVGCLCEVSMLLKTGKLFRFFFCILCLCTFLLFQNRNFQNVKILKQMADNSYCIFLSGGMIILVTC